MKNLLVNRRDQQFVLFEMLDLEKELCAAERFAEYPREVIDMTLDVAHKLAVEEVYPTLMEADREGCRLDGGSVRVPRCFHKLKKLFVEGGWAVVSTSTEAGGQGFPYTVSLAVTEGFISNFAFVTYPFLATGAAHLIEKYGTDAQKSKYMSNMYTGQWGGSMALTEPEAGSDVGNLKTKAIRQPDGTYRITGSKIFITGADSDLYENIINPVLARIEGDPAGTKGISIFLVPKFLVNDDGTLGKRNDYVIAGIEHKMGIKGSATCSISFGDNGDCYAELLGAERQGMKIMFQLMNEARIGVGIQGLGTASAAYQHALEYARERRQGASLMNMMNPDAPRVPILEHADVRRMLLWMKSHVEAMRALVYYCGLCYDKTTCLPDGDEKEQWRGILEILTPVCKAYCTDIGFRVTEIAIQVYGGYGYCQDYPVEQFMRDIKIASIYEGTNGIQALDLVGRKLGMKGGAYFQGLLALMNKTVEENFGGELGEFAGAVKKRIDLLARTGAFFAQCGVEGKFMIPVTHAAPFLNLMGAVVFGWLLLWQAGLAGRRIAALYREQGVDAGDSKVRSAFISENGEAAFYDGKLQAARYYIQNILPGADALVEAIQSGDLSPITIHNESF